MGPSKRIIGALSLAPIILLSAQANSQEAKQLYETNCSSCHGIQFQGTGLGPALSTQSYTYGGRRSDFVRILTNGIASKGMPSFQQSLSGSQIEAIADYLPARTLEQAQEPATEKASDDPSFDTAPGEVSTLDYQVKIEVLANNLDTPWAIAFPNENEILVTERTGSLRLIKNGKLVDQPIKGTPDIFVSTHKWNQGGLLDIALDPKHSENGWVYLSYSHTPDSAKPEGERRGMLRIVRGKIVNHAWSEQELVYQAPIADYNTNAWHYGGRMLFDAKGYLYFSVGDRGKQEQARDLSVSTGKIHRVLANGDIPKDNPYRRKKGALPTIFSFGHRNPQGLALAPNTEAVWVSEHGPRGGDELNIVIPKGDFGWPVATYGINYDGTLLTPNTSGDGILQPALYWRPSIAVSGINFYQGGEFPLWNNKLLVTGLKTHELRLLTIDGDRVQHSETLITFEGRPYEPVVGPDGAIYIALDNPGQILRLSAIKQRKI